MALGHVQASRFFHQMEVEILLSLTTQIPRHGRPSLRRSLAQHQSRTSLLLCEVGVARPSEGTRRTRRRSLNQMAQRETKAGPQNPRISVRGCQRAKHASQVRMRRLGMMLVLGAPPRRMRRLGTKRVPKLRLRRVRRLGTIKVLTFQPVGKEMAARAHGTQELLLQRTPRTRTTPTRCGTTRARMGSRSSGRALNFVVHSRGPASVSVAIAVGTVMIFRNETLALGSMVRELLRMQPQLQDSKGRRLLSLLHNQLRLQDSNRQRRQHLLLSRPRRTRPSTPSKWDDRSGRRSARISDKRLVKLSRSFNDLIVDVTVIDPVVTVIEIVIEAKMIVLKRAVIRKRIPVPATRTARGTCGNTSRTARRR